jgi:hypothetical protein
MALNMACFVWSVLEIGGKQRRCAFAWLSTVSCLKYTLCMKCLVEGTAYRMKMHVSLMGEGVCGVIIPSHLVRVISVLWWIMTL